MSNPNQPNTELATRASLVLQAARAARLAGALTKLPVTPTPQPIADGFLQTLADIAAAKKQLNGTTNGN